MAAFIQVQVAVNQDKPFDDCARLAELRFKARAMSLFERLRDAKGAIGNRLEHELSA